MSLPLNQILCGDAAEVLSGLPDGCAHCCVTSPPYWGLRSYLPKDHPDKPKELGAERTPAEYVENLVAVFRQVRRVLRDDGVLWLNIGDSYCGSWGNSGNRPELDGDGGTQRPKDAEYWHRQGWDSRRERLPGSYKQEGLKPKDLVGIPWMLAFALRDDGWWLRSDNIWHKRSPMPSSVNGWRWERHRVKTATAEHERNLKASVVAHGTTRTTEGLNTRTERGPLNIWADCPGCPKCNPHDGYILRKGSWRCTSAHEYIFMLAKSETYFCDREAVKDRASTEPHSSGRRDTGQYGDDPGNRKRTLGIADERDWATDGSRNKRDVWTPQQKGFSEAHFATFPPDVPETCILAATSAKGCCPECGSPYAPVIDSERAPTRPAEKNCLDPTGMANRDPERHCTEIIVKGYWPTCECDAGNPVPCVVLDPFIGSGTTGLVARLLGRDYIGIELNPEYAKMAERRIEYGNKAPSEKIEPRTGGFF